MRGGLLTVCGLPLKAPRGTKAARIRLSGSSGCAQGSYGKNKPFCLTVLEGEGRQEWFPWPQAAPQSFLQRMLLALAPARTRFPLSGSANECLHPRSSHTSARGWWAAMTTWVMSLGEAYEFCLILGAPVLVEDSKIWEALVPSPWLFLCIFFFFWGFLPLSWTKIHRRWQW